MKEITVTLYNFDELSDEYIIETIRANEYDFTVDGKLY